MIHYKNIKYHFNTQTITVNDFNRDKNETIRVGLSEYDKKKYTKYRVNIINYNNNNSNNNNSTMKKTCNLPTTVFSACSKPLLCDLQCFSVQYRLI